MDYGIYFLKQTIFVLTEKKVFSKKYIFSNSTHLSLYQKNETFRLF